MHAILQVPTTPWTQHQQVSGSAHVRAFAASSSTRRVGQSATTYLNTLTTHSELRLPSCSSIRRNPRWSSVGALNGSSTYRKNKDTALKFHSSISNDPGKYIPCRCCLSKKPSSFGYISSRASAYRLACYISTQTVGKTSSVKQVHVPKAAVGPASSTWTNVENEKTELESFLGSELPSHPRLHRGQLRNGLRYVILPNKVPPNRFEAHVEIHVGSIDEEDDEQGIAHMLEHVADGGSEKRGKLLGGTGACLNAYTGFRHTVFHVHSPTLAKNSDGDMLPNVLVVLNEIAFHPEFLASRVEKERKIILSELQMGNTIWYRVNRQLKQHLHSENKLSRRFPIGLEEQIKTWDVEKIRKFHETWYFPANATLYIVGDIDNISKTIHQIDAAFGLTAAKDATVAASTLGVIDNFLVPTLAVGLGNNFSHDGRTSAVRPPVHHNWCIPANIENKKPPQIFQHELLLDCSIDVLCKVPVAKVQTYGDLRNSLMRSIYLSAMNCRIRARMNSNPSFTSIELDHRNSAGEGCSVTTLTVDAEPQNWQRAVGVAVQEVRRLKEFGVTRGELTLCMESLLKDSDFSDIMSSLDYLNLIMESDALGDRVMEQRQKHESLVAVAATVTLEEVNSFGAKVVEFISNFEHPSAPLPAVIVACVPKKFHSDGKAEINFIITPDEITRAITAGLERPVEPEPELEIPKDLISKSQLQQLLLQHKPSFVPFSLEDVNITKKHDNETGITQRRLSNGIAVNYKVSKSEPGTGEMRLVVGGGRAAEKIGAWGSVALGVETLHYGRRVGNFSNEQLELFLKNHWISYSIDSTEELICMKFWFTTRDNGICAVFQLLHMLLEHSVWLEDAFDRSKRFYLSYHRSLFKSLNDFTARKLKLAMMNGDERFVEDPNPQLMDNLSMDSVRDVFMSQFVGENMEVNIVGDFSEEEVESCSLDFLGTVRATKNLEKDPQVSPIIFRPLPSDLQFQQVLLKDTDARACAYIAGPAPSRWGFTADGEDLFDAIKNKSPDNNELSKSDESSMDRNDANNLQESFRSHPLFFDVTLRLLTVIIDKRLSTFVRGYLGLTYHVSFKLNLFDHLKLGWYEISVTATPGNIYEAVDVCKIVLRGLNSDQLTPSELDSAKRTLLRRHEAEINSNEYWLGLMAGLQASSVPRKDISCIKDLTSLYKQCTIADIYLAYEQLKIDDSSLYSCIGIAGEVQGEN